MVMVKVGVKIKLLQEGLKGKGGTECSEGDLRRKSFQLSLIMKVGLDLVHSVGPTHDYNI